MTLLRLKYKAALRATRPRQCPCYSLGYSLESRLQQGRREDPIKQKLQVRAYRYGRAGDALWKREQRRMTLKMKDVV